MVRHRNTCFSQSRDLMSFGLTIPLSPCRHLVPKEVGSQRVGVQAEIRLWADGRRGTQEAPQPLFPVPDRAASAGQSSAVLPAAVLPIVHRQTWRRPETQRAVDRNPAAGQVSVRPLQASGCFDRNLKLTRYLQLSTHVCFRLWTHFILRLHLLSSSYNIMHLSLIF